MSIAAGSPPLAGASASACGRHHFMVSPLLIARIAATSIPDRLGVAAGAVLRYGLVALVLFFGAFKFTAAEAAAIQPLVSHSPFLSWLYSVCSARPSGAPPSRSARSGRAKLSDALRRRGSSEMSCSSPRSESTRGDAT